MGCISKALSGEIRLVTVPGYDVCACCGTHVHTTGEIGLIKIFSCQKFHEGVRVEMLCGRKAYEYTAELLEQNRQNSMLLSAKPQETSASVKKLLDDLAKSNFRAGQLERKIVSLLLEQYSSVKNPLVFADLSSAAMRTLADSLMQQTDGVCAVLCGTDADGYRYIICQKDGNLKDFCAKCNQKLHGRGGGKPSFTQGTLCAKRAEIEKLFSEEIH